MLLVVEEATSCMHVRLIITYKRCHVPQPHLPSYMADYLTPSWLILGWNIIQASISFNSKRIRRIPISHPCDVSFLLQPKKQRWEKTGTDIGGLVGLAAVGWFSVFKVEFSVTQLCHGSPDPTFLLQYSTYYNYEL
jgi:hypothetical protein